MAQIDKLKQYVLSLYQEICRRSIDVEKNELDTITPINNENKEHDMALIPKGM